MSETDLPYLIVGPIVRRVTAENLVLWSVTTQPPQGQLVIERADQTRQNVDVETTAASVQVGDRAWIVLLSIALNTPLKHGERLTYDWLQHQQTVLPSHLSYQPKSRPSLIFHQQLGSVLHGSCRKPHAPGDDALVGVDRLVEEAETTGAERPSMLIMTGDQVYADDVAGPMLRAIHDVCALLKLWPESWSGASINNSVELHQSSASYYRRESLLPKQDSTLYRRFFAGGHKPIFTSVYAKNHLISLSEVVAMYCLVWSSRLWPLVNLEEPAGLTAEEQQRYQHERTQLASFQSALPAVERAMAHLPVYMMFDDHDVTDDWNLSRAWEEAAYGHPFSRRIIGNALVGYALCQGWGNDPKAITPLINAHIRPCITPDPDDCAVHDGMIDATLHWSQWSYSVPSSPPVVVLDTRTQRWRSEKSAHKPSGLMDWEALTETQQLLLGHAAVLMVSPAPIFGVKVIEVVQRVFTWLGLALMVDAENWMAHRGAAQVMLNIFQHARTPKSFTVLSGDVHYSFVYDVRIRHSKSSPKITQVTASGLKNAFPEPLIGRFDRLNHFLYGRGSPLNLLTKRRRMRIRPRHPSSGKRYELHNQHALGVVKLNEQGEPTYIGLYHPDQSQTVFVSTIDD
ncbi:alkaline phosphatase family protein [Salinispirillum marinum]|uniref:Alkaline phosphatase family protein n=2 Tax=Saccharospirillaceae TaxID=255527 RepID=A0ABV8BGS6_9GAMM